MRFLRGWNPMHGVLLVLLGIGFLARNFGHVELILFWCLYWFLVIGICSLWYLEEPGTATISVAIMLYAACLLGWWLDGQLWTWGLAISTAMAVVAIFQGPGERYRTPDRR